MPTESGVKLCNVYIDGYNFYYSVSKSDKPDLLTLGWCDFHALADRLVRKEFPGSTLGAVKYFTALVGEHEVHDGEQTRQRLWLNALKHGTRGQVRIIYGYYSRQEGKRRVEKQTDVNLAISLMRDVLMRNTDPRHSLYRGRDPFTHCAQAIVISGDGDFLPAEEMAARYGAEVVVYRPLGTDNIPCGPQIRGRTLTEGDLLDSRLPDTIRLPDGSEITWQRYLELKGM